MSTVIAYTDQRAPRRTPPLLPNVDHGLLLALAVVIGLGLVMVASASVSIATRDFDDPLFYVRRQGLYLLAGLILGAVVIRVKLEVWERLGAPLLLLAYLLLIMVLIPGVGREVNGAMRWIPLGVVNLQVSEVAKFMIFTYLAGYLVRRAEAVRSSWKAFLLPVGLMGIAALLLLMEPDFGAVVVMFATGMAMLFLAGVPLPRYLLLCLGAVGAGALLIVTSPYRWARLTGFRNPWEDPFDSGFQLTQSLIAIGRGEWFGVGLGDSVQKLFYLPEAHTDFVFAVLAEELGLIGVLALIFLYGYIVWRCFRIGAHSFKRGLGFGGYIAFAVGTWLALQCFVNMGVNMGILPTKGLTLPLMSYGGSSLISSLGALALLLRADYEARIVDLAAQPARRVRP